MENPRMTESLEKEHATNYTLNIHETIEQQKHVLRHYIHYTISNTSWFINHKLFQPQIVSTTLLTWSTSNLNNLANIARGLLLELFPTTATLDTAALDVAILTVQTRLVER